VLRIRIPDADPDILPIPDPNSGSQISNPAVKKAPDPGSETLELLTKLALMALAESMRTLSLGGMVLPVVF
jgi:hypothetical protein